MFAEELLLSGIISDAMELAASETAEAAELTASDTVLPTDGSEEEAASEEASASPEAVLSEEVSSPAVSSGPETGSSVSAASPVMSPSGISELAEELSEVELFGLLTEGVEEEILELTEDEAEEADVSFLLPHPTIATASAAARAIKSVLFMFLFASVWGSISFLEMNYAMYSSQKLSF